MVHRDETCTPSNGQQVRQGFSARSKSTVTAQVLLVALAAVLDACLTLRHERGFLLHETNRGARRG